MSMTVLVARWLEVTAFSAKTQIQQPVKDPELQALHWKGAQIKYLSLGTPPALRFGPGYF